MDNNNQPPKLSDELKENGWITITDKDGRTYVYNEKFWNEFLYGDVSKLVNNKNK
jgi:hypothetical protein